MSIWLLLGIVFIAGGVGGFVGSFVNGKQAMLPDNPDGGNGKHIFLLGYILNTLIGAVAASVSWLLYGPLSQAQIGAASGPLTMGAATLGGAVLVGMVGSAWLTKAAGQKLFQAAAYNAAAAPASPNAADKMLTASPIEALKITQNMKPGGAPPSPPPQDEGIPQPVTP